MKTVNRTGIRDKKLAQLAVDMRKTEPGDVLSYCRKWVAFQERWTEVLPAIPVYSNVYFDFYTTRLEEDRSYIKEHLRSAQAFTARMQARGWGLVYLIG